MQVTQKKMLSVASCVFAILLFLTGCNLQMKNSEETLPEIKIGIDATYTPYTYIDDQGKYAGLDIDLAIEACRRASYEPIFVAIDWTKKKDCLANKSVDCVWSCFSMNEKQDEYTWSRPYLYSSQVVAVRGDLCINHLEQLQDKSIALQYGSRAEELFQHVDSDKVPSVAYVYSLESLGECFQAMQSGNVDGVVGHRIAVETYAKSSDVSYRILPESIENNQLGVAFDKTQTPYRIKNAIDEALTGMEQDQTIKKILHKWGMTEEQAKP